jgi:hypothetical protein
MGTFRALVLAAGMAMLASNAIGMSVMEVAGKCGDDAKIYCQGVGYGDAMTECLATHYSKLHPACRAVVDRIKNGENVSLF